MYAKIHCLDLLISCKLHMDFLIHSASVKQFSLNVTLGLAEWIIDDTCLVNSNCYLKINLLVKSNE